MNESINQKIRHADFALRELFRREYEPRLSDAIGPIKGRILGYVSCHPGISANELALAFHLKKSTISESLKELVTKGFLRMEPSEQDGRRKALFVTKKALDHKKKCEPVFEEFDRRVASILAEEEQIELSGLLDRIIQEIGGDAHEQ